MRPQPGRRCVVVLGGSFDPIHQGHIALAACFSRLLEPDELRILPAGNPWQKTQGLKASAQDRVEMVRLAFAAANMPVVIDEQEIRRTSVSGEASYTLDTLRLLRDELGPDSSIAFLMGADQLLGLHTWHNWQKLFDYAHICVASRPGFTLNMTDLPLEVTTEFAQRIGTPEQIRNAACGLTCLASDLAVDISATEIRHALQHGDQPNSLIPAVVLDYIQQHHLYKN
ncbi:nicotinate-nucleotide adenylyltransferase [Herminiimonas sp. CN]|uniref:nicotinate-nucleotide adenylyltransferase n=1 Tax=Herminiimonas sp. CN TaxID=1349818 RepID=UPI0004741760